jgi:hypothetical protein
MDLNFSVELLNKGPEGTNSPYPYGIESPAGKGNKFNSNFFHA